MLSITQPIRSHSSSSIRRQKGYQTKRFMAFFLCSGLCMTACGGVPLHGHASAITANAASESDLCEHRIPSSVCTRCNPNKISMFKSVNDWCTGHQVPESQCYACHPDLSFEKLPPPPKNGDIKQVPRPLAVKGFEAFIVKGKVTIVDIWATWCVACRKTAGEINLLLHQNTNIAVRKVEVKDWNDPLAKQYLSGATGLPYLIIFDKRGQKVGTIDGHKPDELKALVATAQKT